MLLRTLLSHYRRHPVQAAFLLAGITIANVLLVGTLLINAQARASQSEGERWLSAQAVATIRARSGAFSFDEREYIQLRRMGFDKLMPVLRRVELSAEGVQLELLGIDAFAMPRSSVLSPTLSSGPASTGAETSAGQAGGGTGHDKAAFAFHPYRLLASPGRVRQLGWAAGDRPRLASGRELPPLTAVPDAGLGHRLLIDIGALQNLTDSRGTISFILVFDAAPERLKALQAALPAQLEWTGAEAAPDPSQLTRSFHLNLSAMGLLTFVVGLFLIYNALTFSYTDRRDMMRKLRLAGVTRSELCRALLTELGLFVLLGTALGVLLGMWLAAILLPGVGLTLAQLYGVYIAYPDRLLTGGLGWPLAMTALASGLCVLNPLRQVLYMPVLQRQSVQWDEQAMVRRDRWLLGLGLVLLAIAGVLALVADALWLALACMAALMLGAALCLPAFLRALLGGLSKRLPARWALSAWIVADCRWLLGPASLALMAMMLALVANSGLNIMIGSFRLATANWLDQRLTAQLHLREQVNVAELTDWLAREAPGVHLATRYRTALTASTPDQGTTSVEVASLPGNERFTASVELMGSLPDAVERFRSGAGVYISERAWRLDRWIPGDLLTVCPGEADVPILGIYRDYGNSRSQWLISTALFKRCWPQRNPDSYALFSDHPVDWDKLRSALSLHLGLAPYRLINQQDLKKVGLGVFDRTFAVTHALNALTLLVAGIGIFCAIGAIHHHRLSQQALLSALGVPRWQRASMLLAQWGVLGLLCVALVWPFGAALAWVLSSVVTPIAFGWSFALQAEWRHLPVLALIAAGALMLAVFLPSLRLLRASPGRLLREQAT
ncbi:MAG TPA: ABC transporter permease [Xanthomonadales bacterium]|nr:ABC transporter permease [Xanthomonadales bacterium]